MAMIDRFEPAMYPLEVNEFIIEHGGEPPERAFAQGLPGKLTLTVDGAGNQRQTGLCQADVYPIIDSLYRLDQAERHSGHPAHAVPAAKAAAKVYLRVVKEIDAERKRGGPPNPSMFSWDSRGKGFHYGPGSDSEFMRTYFDADGVRKPLGVDLIPRDRTEYKPSWVGKQAAVPYDLKSEWKEILDDPEHGILTCPICRFSQNYRLDSSASRNVARGRMSKHLRRPNTELEAHRALYTFEFGTTDASRAPAEEK